MVSVLVDWPKGIDVKVLRVEGNCFWISLGSLGHICFRRLTQIDFWICLVDVRMGVCSVNVSKVNG